jgi:hypothetical protein
MALDTPIASQPAPRTVGAGYLFGIPVGDLGWFATGLVSLAAGFASFFAATFCGIVGLLIYNMASHRTPDYAIAYRLIGLPIGLLVLVSASIYLGSLWIRRMLRKA